MKPLPWIAMGLVVIILAAPVHGYDALPDPLGWVLVLVGTRAVAPDLERGAVLTRLAVLALVASVITWVPAALAALERGDDSLVWAVDLPQVAFGALLSHALAQRASGAGDRRADAWLRLTRTLTVVVGLLPVLVFGAGLDELATASGVASILAPVLLCVLLFRYGSRPWALPEGAGTDDRGRPSRRRSGP